MQGGLKLFQITLYNISMSIIYIYLISIATIPPKPIIFEEEGIWKAGIVLPSSYGGIIPNITIIVHYLNGIINNYIIPHNDITIDGKNITFPLPNDISGTFSVAYRMSFFGENGELSEFSEEIG